jgi:hypothetical protein
MEAPAEAYIETMRADAAQSFGIAFLVSLIPMLIPVSIWCSRRCSSKRRVTRARSSVGDELTAQAAQGAATHKLESASRAAGKMRLRVTGSIFQLGCIGFAIGFTPLASAFTSGRDNRAAIGTIPAWMSFVGFPGFALIYLAPLPTDAVAVRAACAISLVTFTFFGVIFLLFGLLGFTAEEYDVGFMLTFLLGGVSNLVVAGGIIPTLFCSCCCPKKVMGPRAALRRLWAMYRVWLVVVGGIFAYTPISARIKSQRTFNEDHQLQFGVVLLVVQLSIAFLATPRNRGRVHAFFGSLGTKSTKEAEAATISALVGGGSASNALSDAKARFRALPLAELQSTDLVSNDDTGLFAKTAPASLGKVTGFVSHSWQDDGVAKHKQLTAWGEEAKRDDGVDAPLIWLDKACIKQDQSAEEKQADIHALPVFLSGCRALVVLAGPTYASRLWCVVELFVFLKMGGERERIRVMELGGVDVRVALNRFRAQEAKCFLKEDQERLLAVVESGFGSLQPFNILIRSIFIDARATNLESLVVASSEGTARKLKELEAKLDRQADGIRALMKAQGLTVESAPLLAEDL